MDDSIIEAMVTRDGDGDGGTVDRDRSSFVLTHAWLPAIFLLPAILSVTMVSRW